MNHPSNYYIFSPAKINLGLKILYKRTTDNYHQIESIFIPISFGDDLIIQTIPYSHSPFPSKYPFSLQTQWDMPQSFREPLVEVFSRQPSQNLMGKAWYRIQALLTCYENTYNELNESIPCFEFHCKITKRIPAGAGLGGGSSNAASLLLFALEKNWITPSQAEELARELGADVPFFLKRQPAWVTGIGDVVEPISVGQGWGILYPPGIFFSTAVMYEALKKSLQKPLPSKPWKEQEREIVLAIERGDWKSLQGKLTNDFEEVAFQLEPGLAKLSEWFLQSGAEYVSMTGSGSALYALFSSREKRNQAYNHWTEHFPNQWMIPFSFPIGLSPSGKASVFGTDIS